MSGGPVISLFRKGMKQFLKTSEVPVYQDFVYSGFPGDIIDPDILKTSCLKDMSNGLEDLFLCSFPVPYF